MMDMGLCPGLHAPDACRGMLERFEHASEELLSSRALQHRVDRKYVMSASALEPLLARLCANYQVVRAGEQPVARYESVYFDTRQRELYHDHRRGRRPRYKVRIRHHLDRRRAYLEVKRKTHAGRTLKARLELPFHQWALDADARRFIDAHCPIGASRLVPSLSVAFRRVTLVAAAIDERLTFDDDLMFCTTSASERLADVVIAEIKQPGYSNTTGAAVILRTMQVREQAFSKYCAGTALLIPVRMNAFKPVFHAVERLRRCENS